MTFRRFIKLIRKFPYLLNDNYVRSLAEANELLRTHAPTLREAVARAKARADLPDKAWVYPESLAERIDRKNERKQRIIAAAERFGEQLRSHRRLAATCAILLVVLAYFTLIPSGKTMAKNFFEHIMSIAGNRIEFRLPTKSDDTIIVDPDFEEIHETTSCEYSSVREYIKATGMIPYTLNYRTARFLPQLSEALS